MRLAPGSRKSLQISLKPEGLMRNPSPRRDRSTVPSLSPQRTLVVGKDGERLGLNGKGLQEPQCNMVKKGTKNVYFGKQVGQIPWAPWMGCGCPMDNLRTEVTIRAMQWLLVTSVRRKLVDLGHLCACAWAEAQCQRTPTHAPPQTPAHLGSSGTLLPCTQCPVPGDRAPCFLKIWKAKWGRIGAFCA